MSGSGSVANRPNRPGWSLTICMRVVVERARKPASLLHIAEKDPGRGHGNDGGLDAVLVHGRERRLRRPPVPGGNDAAAALRRDPVFHLVEPERRHDVMMHVDELAVRPAPAPMRRARPARCWRRRRPQWPEIPAATGRRSRSSARAGGIGADCERDDCATYQILPTALSSRRKRFSFLYEGQRSLRRSPPRRGRCARGGMRLGAG